MNIFVRNNNDKNKKVLVHFHLFYYEQLDYFIRKLKNISCCNWDLYVTICEKNDIELLKLKNFKPDVKVIEVKNIGYDIWPFIQVLRKVNLKDYDYILKVHTKNYRKDSYKIPNYKYKNIAFIGYTWRNQLIKALIDNPFRFRKNLEILSVNKKIGFISDESLIVKSCNEKYIDKLKTRLSIHSNYEYFLAGTMFMMRAGILQKLVDSDLSEKDFDISLKTGSDGTLAHAVERIFTVLTDDCGYKVLGIKDKSLEKYSTLGRLSFLQRIFSVTNSEDKRHKILTVLGLKIKLKKHQKFVFPKGTVIKSANIIDNESINYKNKTATIFAMFSVDGLIADNTIEYLTELRKFSDYIVLVGDCPIFENELLKLSGIVDSYIFERHNEYDFGSYKRGFQHLSKNDILKNVDNIIFCNDSVIYLGTSLEDIFINAKKHKFYGITINNGGYSKKLKLINNAPHIQSYFVSISSNIFSENYFKIFMNSIKHFNNKKKIIYNYEQGLSRIIQENGNSLNTYYPPINVSTYFEPCHYYLNENSNFKGPKYFIKKFLIKNYRKVELDENLELVGGKG